MVKAPHFRSVFISDTHLGSKDCKAEFLLHFLNNMTCDTLYLVGDIVDMWSMSKQFRWPDAHNEVMHKIITLSHGITKVIFLPGNHDAPLQKYAGMQFGDIEIHRQCIHKTADNKHYLVLHGDQCDDDVTLGKFHAWLGDKAYDTLLFVNRWFNQFRSWRNGHYWSLAGYIKRRIKGANQAIGRYKTATTKRAAEMGLDGVICGHIHHPESDLVNGIHYVNDGDWIENCSALVEDLQGRLSLIDWVAYTKEVTVSVLDVNEVGAKTKAA
jgi:UDP-2,3-diacylglucosamine pyrophosphatase LpxH